MVMLRFAPTPSGGLHLGGARVALLNHAIAKTSQGQFALRFDDSNLPKHQHIHEDVLLWSLHQIGIDTASMTQDKTFRRQSIDLERYHRVAAELLNREQAYICQCAPIPFGHNHLASFQCSCKNRAFQIDPEQQQAIRLSCNEKEIQWQDLVYGQQSQTIYRDPVIIRQDGRPLYHFATVVDDLELGVTHVIRGADHLQGTGVQAILYSELKKEPPVYAHIPLLIGSNQAKLSKRHGDATLGDLIRRGFQPHDIIQYLKSLDSESVWHQLEQAKTIQDCEIILGQISKERVYFSTGSLKRCIDRSFSERTDKIIQSNLTHRLKNIGLWASSIKENRDWTDEFCKAIVQYKRSPSLQIQWALAMHTHLQASELNKAEGSIPIETSVLQTFLKQLPIDADSLDTLWDWKRYLEQLCLRPRDYGLLRAALFGFSSGPELHILLHCLGKAGVQMRALNFLASIDGQTSLTSLNTLMANAEVTRLGLLLTQNVPDCIPKFIETKHGPRNKVFLFLDERTNQKWVAKISKESDENTFSAYRSRQLYLANHPKRDMHRCMVIAQRHLFAQPVLFYTYQRGNPKPGNQYSYQDKERICEHLAELHASPIPTEYFRSHLGPTSLLELFKSVIEKHQDTLRVRASQGQADTPLSQTLTQLIVETSERLSSFTPAAQHDYAFCHTDLETRNIVFDSLSHPQLIDWESAMIAHPLIDLAHFLNAIDAAPSEESALLSHYAVHYFNNDKQDTQPFACFQDSAFALSLLQACRSILALQHVIDLIYEFHGCKDEHERYARRHETLNAIDTLQRFFGHYAKRLGRSIIENDPLLGIQQLQIAIKGLEHGIVIDGEAKSFKTPIAVQLSKALNMQYAPMGAYFRLIAFLASEQGISLNDTSKLLTILPQAQPRLETHPNPPFVTFVLTGHGHRWLNQVLFTEQTAAKAARISQKAELENQVCTHVRSHGTRILVDARFGAETVLPDAQHCFFLHRGFPEKAATKPQSQQLSAIERQFQQRDQKDASYRAFGKDPRYQHIWVQNRAPEAVVSEILNRLKKYS